MICSSVNRLGFMSIPLRGDGLYSFLEEFLGLRSPDTAPPPRALAQHTHPLLAGSTLGLVEPPYRLAIHLLSTPSWAFVALEQVRHFTILSGFPNHANSANLLLIVRWGRTMHELTARICVTE